MDPRLASPFLVLGWIPVLAGIYLRRSPERAAPVVPRLDRVLVVATYVFCILLTGLAALSVLGQNRSALHHTLGVALFLAGNLVWLWGRAAMSTSFAQVVLAPAQLVTHGPFRYVRHPLYASTILACLGQVWASQDPACLMVWGALFATFTLRARREEHVLQLAFGSRWATYKKHTLNLFPPWR
jgi:protein-S-isoprenylcysteine O-methyltransferase Ste14